MNIYYTNLRGSIIPVDNSGMIYIIYVSDIS
jgi:hypothetical protein